MVHLFLVKKRFIELAILAYFPNFGHVKLCHSVAGTYPIISYLNIFIPTIFRNIDGYH